MIGATKSPMQTLWMLGSERAAPLEEPRLDNGDGRGLSLQRTMALR